MINICFIFCTEFSQFLFCFVFSSNFRSQWPRGLRRRSAAARLLRLWVRIPPEAWMFVCCECCVLSSRGLCDGLITRPEESYWLWRVVVRDQKTSKTRRLKPASGLWKYNYNRLWRQEMKQTFNSNNPLNNILRVPRSILSCLLRRLLELNVCLFSWRHNLLWLYFHSPVAGFSLLVFEVSWSRTTTHHSQ